MSVEIKIDKATQRRLNESLKGLENIDFFEATVNALFRIKALAQLRLTEKSHIVTSRLKNSIYVKTPNQKHANRSNNNRRYTDNEGRGFDADLTTVNLDKNEGAVGTNVEYAGKIERMDSYIYWGAKNIQKDIRQYFKDIMKENQRKYKK